MSFRRILASILLTLSAVSIGESKLVAQSSTNGNSLLVPITGVADLGGMFSGAFIVERFVQQQNGIVAMGTVTGALIVNGTFRNLVIQTALPLDLSASRARLNTDPALAQASCDVLHVELGGTTVSVLGATLGFNPVSFDVAAATASASTRTSNTSGTSNTAAPAATGASQPGAMTPAAPQGTVTPSVSANTTQATSSTPGTVPQTPTATTPVPTQMQLRPLLCAVDRFKTVSDQAQLVQQLNAILTALAAATTGQ